MAIELAPPCYNELTLEEWLPIFLENGVGIIHIFSCEDSHSTVLNSEDKEGGWSNILGRQLK
ncbi:MAG: hypothetical protein DRQ02_09420 [Candidatus Latescibacterota bacterium]|nr:MAG: hypothetical protein DRQ02_09420 [Candidatus Latescibacterota bacterium]